MKLSLLILITFLFYFPADCQQPITYPPTEKNPVIDTIWHKPVEDPYRWMEAIYSDKTKQWLKNQEPIRDKYAGKLASNLAEHLTNYSRINTKNISKQGKYYFTYQIFKLTESPSLYCQLQPEDEPFLLFDPNKLDRSAVIGIDGITLSEDERTLAIILSKNGGDWKTIRFLDIESRTLLKDSVNFVKYSPVYWSDNGVFYIKYDVKDISESFNGLIHIKALQYHKLGTSQNDDISVYTPEDFKDDFSFEVTPGKRYLIFYQRKKRGDKIIRILSYRNLPLIEGEEFKKFIQSEGKSVYFNVVGEIGNKLLVASDLNAANGTVYKCDPLQLNSLEKFIPQYKEQLQTSAILNDNKFIFLYNGDKRSYAMISDSLGTKLKTWTIPEGFRFSGLSYAPGDSVLLYYFNSFFNPSSVFKMNLNTFEQQPLLKTIVPFSFKDLTTEIVYYYSKDSTRIPMFLTHKKNMKLDGKTPTILYGYGGFGISTTPFFDVANVAFLNNGGLLAVPKLRGGGDFPNWHEQGMRLNKQNTFDDFIYAAEYLISNNYTNAGKIAAMGGSNGGLLVGACITQRPDLFKVAVSTAGVLDMLRYHVYNIGYKYEEEYGNINDSVDFENLSKYSPVQQVKKDVDYPATLLVASDNDDRVLPFHSFKFLSQLQTKGSGKNPYVLYYQEKSGHQGNDVFDDRINTKAYIYAFIFKYLGMERYVFFED